MVTHNQATTLFIHCILLCKLSSGQEGILWPAVCLEIEAYLVFNNGIPELFHKFADTMHVCFICLVASRIGMVGYDQQLILDTLESPEMGLMEAFVGRGQIRHT